MLRFEKKALIRQVREWVIVIAVAVLIATLVRGFVLQQFYISGPSMEPTMFQDNRVLVDKMTYRFREPRIGDVVVFDRVTMNGTEVQHDDLIKRVVATPGDTIAIVACSVLVDDQPLDESYLPSYGDGDCGMSDMNPLTVPAGEFFVMGDNRPESFDSRSFGTIKSELIVGRAFAIIWPLGAAKRL